MNELKKASDWLSPVSRIFVTISTYIPAAVIFRPSLFECLAVFLVDMVMMIFVVNPFEGPIFCKLYPESRLFFNQVDHEKISGMDSHSRTKFLHILMKFPRKRAAYMYFGTLIKNVPLILIMVFYWKHSVSDGIQLLLVVTFILIMDAYFYAAIYFELHFYLSRLVVAVHKKHDFTDSFLMVSPRYSKRELEIHDLLTLLSIMFFVMAMQAAVVFSGDYRGTQELSLKLGLISLGGLALFGHIWYLSRSFFTGGLEKLFEQMAVVDYKKALSILPVHTSPLLAQFEKTFNVLVARLKSSEQELASFLFQEAEKSRYRALGEMSALIAHDLSSPLHVVQYCVEELQDSDAEMGGTAQRKYLDPLAKNVARAIDLINSLKARIRSSVETSTSASFLDVHEHVIYILDTYFSNEGFKKIRFEVDPRMGGLILFLSRVELIQILDNIYRNASQNLLKNRVQDPTIRISLHSQNSEDASMIIEDNGTGLTQSDFEMLTSFQFVTTPESKIPKGLGLRLTRRLVEFHQGSLEVLNSETGTRFLLKLKKEERAGELLGSDLLVPNDLKETQLEIG